MELVTMRVPSTRVPLRQLAVLALIGLLLAAALAVYIGSQRSKLPPPYGLARNGAVTFVTTDGDIAIADPATNQIDVVVASPEQETYPTFSLDGTRIAYLQYVGTDAKVMVIDLERRQPVEVAQVVRPAGLLQWSPDGKTLAFVEGRTLWTAATDGSGAAPRDLGFDVQDELEWRPPDGKDLVVRGLRDGKAGLFLVALDGSAPRPITPMTGGEFDFLWLTWSPDGARLAYSNADPKEVHIIDVRNGIDSMLEGDAGIGLMFPRWSPDGARLAVMTWLSETPTRVRLGVLPSDDPSPHVTLTGPTFTSGIQHDWAPDGASIFAVEWESDQPWLLDPDGGPEKRLSTRAAFPDWIEWQRVAR